MGVPIQPLGEYVVVQKEKAETKTSSGFYLPEKSKEAPKTVQIVAVGKDVKELKVGDRILYEESYSDASVKIDSEEYTIVKEEKIVAKVNA